MTTPPDFSPDVRTDPLTGVPAVIVARRQERPLLPAHGCPFCPGGLEAPEPGLSARRTTTDSVWKRKSAPGRGPALW